MWKVELVQQLDLVIAADSNAGRCPLTDAIQSYYGSLLVGTWKEGACCMGFVMFGKNVLSLKAPPQCLVQLSWDMKFLFELLRYRHQKLTETSWTIRKVRFQKPVKLQ